MRDTPSQGVEGAEEQSPRTGWLSLSCSPKCRSTPPPPEAWKCEVSGADTGRDGAQAAGGLLRAARRGEAGTNVTGVDGEPATLRTLVPTPMK